MIRQIQEIIYEGIDPKAYQNEEIIFLYPNDDREITTIEVEGDELKETILYLLDKYLPIGIIFNNYEIENDIFQIKVKFLV